MCPRISVVMNTLNEEKNLPYALRSVKSWADEIVIVDMYSDDRTVIIAQEFGAKVFFHEKMGYADPARAFAISKASGDWILILDADELVPHALSLKLLDIARNDEADIVLIPWLNYFFGTPVMHTGWGPNQDAHERFFKTGCIQVTASVHDFLSPVSNARILKLPYQPGVAMIHFNYIDISHFIEKLNRYTTIEAIRDFDRKKSSSTIRALLSASREFILRYIILRGYRDGWRGFYLSLLIAIYRLIFYAKLAELGFVGTRESIEERYRDEAEQILNMYELSKPDA